MSDSPIVPDFSLSRVTVPVERLYVQELVPDNFIANVEVHELRETFEGVVVRLSARVLAGDYTEVHLSERVTFDETVQWTEVEGVWDAICVFWVAPAFRWLFGLVSWLWLLRVSVWGADHATTKSTRVERTKHVAKTERVPKRFCPHIAVPDTDRHVQFLVHEGRTEW